MNNIWRDYPPPEQRLGGGDYLEGERRGFLGALVGIPERVLAWVRGTTLPADDPRTVNMLRRLAEKGGFVNDGDPFEDLYEAEIREACGHGLVTYGGGWGYGFSLTRKGERAVRRP